MVAVVVVGARRRRRVSIAQDQPQDEADRERNRDDRADADLPPARHSRVRRGGVRACVLVRRFHGSERGILDPASADARRSGFSLAGRGDRAFRPTVRGRWRPTSSRLSAASTRSNVSASSAARCGRSNRGSSAWRSARLPRRVGICYESRGWFSVGSVVVVLEPPVIEQELGLVDGDEALEIEHSLRRWPLKDAMYDSARVRRARPAGCRQPAPVFERLGVARGRPQRISSGVLSRCSTTRSSTLTVSRSNPVVGEYLAESREFVFARICDADSPQMIDANRVDDAQLQCRRSLKIGPLDLRSPTHSLRLYAASGRRRSRSAGRPGQPYRGLPSRLSSISGGSSTSVSAGR